MDELFGLPLDTLMFIAFALFLGCAATFAWVFVANRVMFRMGIRNIRRRVAQTLLVVSGLMLATVIITASFVTGDTLDYSVTTVAYENLQRTDLSLHHFRSASSPDSGDYAPESTTAALETAFAEDPDIEGFFPFLYEELPAANPRARQVEPATLVAGFDPVRLERFGGLRYADGGRVDLAALGDDEVLLNEKGADKLDARVGDTIDLYVQGRPVSLRVAGVVRDERASGVLDFGTTFIPGMAAKLSTVQRLTGHAGQIDGVSVALRGKGRGTIAHSEEAAARLEAFVEDRQARAAVGLEDFTFKVEENKRDGVEDAELVGNVFTTMFLVLGLFSIAAGVMLIFTLFVMLAAERRSEMGIARAVGATRLNIVQAFIAEGVVYDIVAGLVGVVLGILVAFTIIIGGAKLAFGEELAFIEPYLTPTALILSFSLGAVLTFATVVVSSVRISRLNIVAAVRGQAEPEREREAARRLRWPWVVLGIAALVVPPLGLYWLFRKGLGLPWALVLGPAGLISAGLLLWAGQVSGLFFPFSLGMSLVPLSLAFIARHYGAPERPTWTAAGIALAVYWLAPFDVHTALFGELTGDMEMFVFSGIMIVTALTLIIVFNARLMARIYMIRGASGWAKYRTAGYLAAGTALLALLGVAFHDVANGLGELFYLGAVFGGIFLALALIAARFPRFAPALKMGVAYPLASRFRTGMTIAMFSIVIFAITVMGIINNSFLDLMGGEDARASWDIIVQTNPNNPIPDLQGALREAGAPVADDIAAQGSVTEYDKFDQVRQRPTDEWSDYGVLAMDDHWLAATSARLDARARGYETDREVYEAIRSGRPLAILDSLTTGGGGWGIEFSVDVDISGEAFDPFTIEVRDPATGRSSLLTVIGVFSARIPPNVLYGVYIGEAMYRSVFGTPSWETTFVRLAPGVDDRDAARAIEAALVERGVQAESIKQQIDEALAQQRGFLRVFQAFMALGLVVGVAALGVIALRSVVERRQQIGMLRAIGYQRGTVALSFLLESGFIAFMGILSGVGGAAILSWNLLSDDTFTGTDTLEFFIPWTEVIAYGVVSFVVAMVMTWWPSRRAASVPVAEALRYE
jgi:putative ABC transport system permease protein